MNEKSITITCPSCNASIDVQGVLAAETQEKLKREFEAKVIAMRQTSDAEKAKSDLEMTKQKTELEKENARKLEVQKKEFEKQTAAKELALEEARKSEVAALKLQAELEERNKNLDVEVQKRARAEVEVMEEAISKRVHEESELRFQQEKRKNEDLNRQIGEWKRKAEQGSQQAQGEILEERLKGILEAAFPGDEFADVAKGKKGADIIYKVLGADGAEAGKILIEAKRTKGWGKDWPDKLKGDMREGACSIGVIITDAMPEGSKAVENIDGVWVTRPGTAVEILRLLREQIIRVTQARTASNGADGKKQELFKYLSGDEFRQYFTGLAESMFDLKDQIDAERLSMEKHWKAREENARDMFKAVVHLAGTLKTLSGSDPIPTIRGQELTLLPGRPARRRLKGGS